MTVIPIALSVAVSHFSGASLVSMTADIYRTGARLWWMCLSIFLTAILGSYVYLPVFFKLQLTSTYEYLEKRFDNKTRLLGVIFYLLNEMIMMPFFIYCPALAFSTASGINVHLISFVVSGICIFYTTIGGFKTVVWSDILQLLIVIISLVTVSAISIHASGGFLSTWNTALKGERLDLFDFSLNSTNQDSIWAIAFGYTVVMTSALAIHQTGVQKFLALPTFRSCIWSIIYSALSLSVVYMFYVLLGLQMYAKYWDCDPLTSKKIKKSDQLLPFYVMDIAGKIPFVPGLFIAAVFSASLSSVSSTLNSLSGVVYKDFVRRLLKKEPSEKTISNILKSIVAISGIACTCLVFVIERLGGLLPLILTLKGLSAGPLVGLFTLGMVFPKANAKGAFYGTMVGLVLITSLAVPAKYYENRENIPKQLFTNSCAMWNETSGFNMSINKQTLTKSTGIVSPTFLFEFSLFTYPVIGVLATLVVGLVVSYCSNTKDRPVDKALISPICHFMLDKDTRHVETPLLVFEKNLATGRHQQSKI